MSRAKKDWNMEFPHILVMSASAGSGKTYNLSKRYVAFLLTPDIPLSPRNILAITFTNKAAGEMKHRIISRLKEIALGDSDLKERAGEKLDELLDKYSDLKVQTIDSFLTSITMSSALELDLPPHFEIILDSSPALDFVLDGLLSLVNPALMNQGGVYQGSRGEGEGITRLFLNLLRELLRIDPEIGWDIKRIILKNINDLRRQEFLKGLVLRKVFSFRDIKNKRVSIEEAIKKLLKSGTLDFDRRFLKAANKFIEDKQFQPWDSKMFLKEHVAQLCKKNSAPTPDHQRVWEGIRKEISGLTEITAHCRFSPFINLLTRIDSGMQSFKNRAQAIFIEDLNIQLRAFLRREGIVPEVYFRLGDRISHFLIDEFQDTSRLQWENLFPLIEETLSKAGSLFYVGDKKQAIYGFRGGESALFDEAKVNFASIQEENIEEVFPEINYRSRENIVSFVNEVFCVGNLASWAKTCRIDDESPDLSLLLETYAHVHQIARQDEEARGGLVRVEGVPANEPMAREELEAEVGRRLIDLIQHDIMPRFSPRDIAVLVRTNAEASWVTGIMTGVDIPVASEKTLDISSNSLVQELVGFLAFLDSPIDDLSFACFIGGDIFLEATGLTPETISSFLLERRGARRPLYTLFRDRFPEVWRECLEEYFNMVGFLPAYDLASRILKKYSVFQNFPDDEGFFCQFLEVLSRSESERGNSLKGFLDLWYGPQEKKEDFQVVLPEYTDAVKVLTIHKAKGLGFPIVICPLAYINNAPISEVYEKEADHCVPYRVNKKYIGVSSKLEKLYKEKFSAQLIDELNAFYVAVTRAKDELYIFLPNYKSMVGKLPVPVLSDTLAGAGEPILEIGSPLLRSARAPERKQRHVHLPLTNEWQDKLHRPSVSVGELADVRRKKAQARGTLIHDLLAGIEKLPERWPEELAKLLGSLSEDQKEIVPLVRHLFAKEEFRKWFVLPDDVQVFCEKEIVASDGSLHRADRVLLSSEKVVVIEFKSGEPRSEEHRKQLGAYLKLLAGIYPDKRIEGWLVYIDKEAQEKVLWAR